MLKAYVSCPKNMFSSSIFVKTLNILGKNKIQSIFWKPGNSYSIEDTDKLIKDVIDLFVYIPQNNLYNNKISEITAGSRREILVASKVPNLKILIPYALMGNISQTNLYETRFSQDEFYLLAGRRVTEELSNLPKKERSLTMEPTSTILHENEKLVEKYSYEKNLLLYLK